MGGSMIPLRSLLAGALLCATAVHASAAPLDVTPETLIERANLLRDARERPWDPDTGLLGNLRNVHIIANDCTVRVVSGPENRLFLGSGTFRVADSSYSGDRQRNAKTRPYDVTISAATGASAIPRVGADNAAVCFTLQLATAHELLLRGDNLKLLFDRVDLPVLRMYVNPSHGVKLWFHDVRLGLLSVQSNATVVAGGTGQVQWLQLASSQASTALLFHDMEARHAGVTATTTGARFSIRIGADTEAGYYQPARAPGRIALEYPIWIDGPVAALKVPAGRVNPLPMNDEIRNTTRTLRAEVLGLAGPAPSLPAASAGSASPSASSPTPAPISPRQRVADVLQPLLRPGMTLGKVDLWNGGGALEGRAPDEVAVRDFARDLKQSGEVRSAQVARIQRNESGVAEYRVMVNFLCAAPGERSVCLPAAGSSYTQQQIEAALRPVLAPQVQVAQIELTSDGTRVLVKGRASEADARAALERVRTQLPWLEGSSSSMGKDEFSARFRMACTVPPRSQGICTTEGSGR
ncbi:fimbrial assembly family protein [Acidovorax sp. RAC01]|nr:fimbrial assembly family protein [Acidovorax sp. RAC01]